MSGTRIEAVNYLKTNLIEWPRYLEKHIGTKEFKGWRFVEAFDGLIYFVNCADKGITKSEMHYINDWPMRCSKTRH